MADKSSKKDPTTSGGDKVSTEPKDVRVAEGLKLTFLTLNLGKNNPPEVLVRILEQEKPHVVFLQEAPRPLFDVPQGESLLGNKDSPYKTFHEEPTPSPKKGKGGERGLLVTLLRRDVAWLAEPRKSHCRPSSSSACNYLRLLKTGPFINIHNGTDNKDFTELDEYLTEVGDDPLVVLAGDFNAVIRSDDMQSRSGEPKEIRGKQSQELERVVVEKGGLCDVVEADARREHTRGRTRYDRIYIRDPDRKCGDDPDRKSSENPNRKGGDDELRAHVNRVHTIKYLDSDHDAFLCDVVLRKGPPERCSSCSLWLTECGECESVVHVLPAESLASETADSKSAASESADSKSTDSKSTDSKSADSKSADSKSTDSKSADSKSADSKSADSKSTDSKSTDSKSATSESSVGKWAACCETETTAWMSPSGMCTRCEKAEVCVKCDERLPVKQYGQMLVVQCCVCRAQLHNHCAYFKCSSRSASKESTPRRSRSNTPRRSRTNTPTGLGTTPARPPSGNVTPDTSPKGSSARCANSPKTPSRTSSSEKSSPAGSSCDVPSNKGSPAGSSSSDVTPTKASSADDTFASPTATPGVQRQTRGRKGTLEMPRAFCRRDQCKRPDRDSSVDTEPQEE